nr:thioredoxin domain-containing protein [Micromonospora sp. NBC_01699]
MSRCRTRRPRRAAAGSVERFGTPTQDPDFAERVATDQRDGATLGVRGTPTFFINGTPINGLPDHATFVALLDRELAR